MRAVRPPTGSRLENPPTDASRMRVCGKKRRGSPAPTHQAGTRKPQHKNTFRRRPTLPHSPPCSTIGAEELSYRVRNVTGRFPFAITTGKLTGPPHITHNRPKTKRTAHCSVHTSRLLAQNHTADANTHRQALGLLVPVTSTPHRASRPGLSTQSSPGSLTTTTGEGVLISKQASRLDAFSGYPSRT